MMLVSCLLLFLCVLRYANAFYEEGDDVTVLTTENWEEQVLSSHDLWLVEFYAPWCGHCKNLTPEWKKAGTILKGIAKMGAVDATENTIEGIEVSGYPTIKVFSVKKSEPLDYEGDRTARGFAAYAHKELGNIIKSRLGIKTAAKPKTKDVIHLTAESFEEEVMNSDQHVLVEFYAPWCGHCKSLKPVWEKAATEIKKKGWAVKLTALDATRFGDIASKYGVKGYPTIKVFGPDKSVEPEDYASGRDQEGIVQFAKELVNGKEPKNPWVTDLTDADFDDAVLPSEDNWIVEFYAPWCGHCKELKPQFEKTAEAQAGKAKFGAVDATINSELAKRFNISSYPTLYAFGVDKSNPQQMPWMGASGFASAAKTQIDKWNAPPRPVSQLTSNAELQEKCSVLCLITFLPHILDSKTRGRNSQLATVQDVAKRFRGSYVNLLWAEAGAFPELEASVGVSHFPSAVLANAKKQVSVNFVGVFSGDGLAEFVQSGLDGKIKTLKWKVPTIGDVAAWDGHDATHEEL